MPMTGANQTSLAHQPRDPLAAMLLAVPLQLGMNTGAPYVWRELAYTVRTRFSSAASATAWADDGR